MNIARTIAQRLMTLAFALIFGSIVFGGAADAQVVRDAYLQQLTSDSVLVVFRTEMAFASDPIVEYGTTPLAFDSTATGYSMVPPSGMGARDKIVPITGLAPETTYYYRFGTVSDGVLGGGSETHRFTTAALVGSTQPFSAWVLGDSGTAEPKQLAVRDAMLVELDGVPPDLFIHVGDIAYEAGTDAQYTQRFFSTYSEILNRAPFWPTIGNHDADSANSMGQTGPYFEGYFLPTAAQLGGVASGTEAYYSFDHHNVHFIMIDTAEGDLYPPSIMLDWVIADLSNTLADWVVAVFHHPPYSKGSHDSDDGTDSGGRMVLAREFLVPLLEAGGVDLILSGHSHSYERSRLIQGAFGFGTVPNMATPDYATLLAGGHILQAGDGNPYGDGPYTKPPGVIAPGEVCIVAGHGGRSISGPGGHPVMAIDEFENGSCLLRVDGDLLWVENLRGDGSLTDRVALSKGTRVHRIFATVEGCGSIARSIERPLFATGEVVTLTAESATGWLFSEWVGALSGPIASETLTVTADATVTARFVRVETEGFAAYNDFGWVPGQMEDRLTKITSPNGGSGLPSSGVLVDRETGLETGVTLTVEGGTYGGPIHGIAGSGAPVIGTDAWLEFHYHLNPHGSISYQNAPSPAGDLVLTLSGLDPTAQYEVILYSNRNDEGWDTATSFELLGAESFVNDSSLATDNPDPASGGMLFSGPLDATTRIPALNEAGYVVRYREIDPGSDGLVVLRLVSDGELGTNRGKYANALGLIETPGPFLVPFLRGDLDGSGDLDLADAIRLLGVLFVGQLTSCLEAADIDGNLDLELGDPIMLLEYLFGGGPPPAAPWPACDTVTPALGCDFAPPCF